MVGKRRGFARLVMRCMQLMLLGAVVAVGAAEVDAPVDVPDDAGLGERLALVAWLQEHHVAIADVNDLRALRGAYLAKAHPGRADQAAAPADQQSGDLAAELYRRFGRNPPVGASADDIRALIAALDEHERVSVEQEAAAAEDDDQTHPHASAASAPTHEKKKPSAGTAPPSVAVVPGAVPWPETPAPRDGDAPLAEAIARVQASQHIPALAAAVVRSDGLQSAAVVGWRKLGDPTPARVTDCWHLGSDTKAMTASLAALLVQRQLLRWDTTLGSLLPSTPAQWRATTLDQLLMHRASLPRDIDWRRCRSRLEVLDQLIKDKPFATQGSEFRYSNVGYVLAGLMIERASDSTWEDFIAQELWKPLGITGAGFGGMGTAGEVDQPWGHHAGGVVVGNGPAADNPPLFGPAGTVHMPLADWSRFIADHLRGMRGQSGLLSAESYTHLHRPAPGGTYACGWAVAQRPWAKGVVLTHDGTNRMNYAVVWLAPNIDLAVLVCCNQGDAGGACDAAVRAVLALYHL